MDLRQLSTLIAIAEHGSFSSAARALYTVQSNVSAHVAKLERQLGVMLVERSTGRMTEEGQRVVEGARRIMNELDDIRSDVTSADADVAGDARVGVIGTVAGWLMAPLLARVARDHPRVHPIISEGSTSALIPNVVGGQLHAALVHLPLDDADLDVRPLFEEELVLLVPNGHELASSPPAQLSDLDRVPLLLPPRGSALRRILERAAADADITLAARSEIDGVRLLAALALDGHGAAIVPAPSLGQHVPDGVTVARPAGLPRRVVGLATRRRPRPSAATRVVLDALESTVVDLLDPATGVHSLS